MTDAWPAWQHLLQRIRVTRAAEETELWNPYRDIGKPSYSVWKDLWPWGCHFISFIHW